MQSNGEVSNELYVAVEVHADPNQDPTNSFDGYDFQTYLTFAEGPTAQTVKCAMTFKNNHYQKVMHKNVPLSAATLDQWCSSQDHPKMCNPWMKTACPSGDCMHMHYQRGQKIYARCGIKRAFKMLPR